MLPFYKIALTEESDGVDFIAFVDVPAHLKAFEYFGKTDRPKMIFNEEKRIVTGVAISVDQPIYRNSEESGEHYVIFDANTTFEISKRLMKNSFMHNVNEMHEANKIAKGVYMIESYFIDRTKGKNPPNAFENQNLKNGSWIISYYVENDKIWNDVKKGNFIGFSVEGWFDKKLITKNTNKKNEKMNKKTGLAKFVESFKKQKFGSTMTVDGVEVVWDGEELAEGIELRVVTEEGEVLAPEGEHALVIGDVTKIVTVDANGVISSISDVEENSDAEVNVEEFKKQFKAEINAENLELINSLKSELKTIKEDFKSLVKAIEEEEKGKFNTKTITTSSVPAWKKIGK